jgi:hypothetical protein
MKDDEKVLKDIVSILQGMVSVVATTHTQVSFLLKLLIEKGMVNGDELERLTAAVEQKMRPLDVSPKTDAESLLDWLRAFKGTVQ